MTETSNRAGVRGFLFGTGTAAAAAVLFFFVSRASEGRAPGGALTGTVPKSEPVADTDVARLQEAVRSHPDDIEARLDLASVLLRQDDMMQVFDQTREVLQRSPGHPRALTYQALVRMEMGQLDTAERMLRQALATEPDFLDAYIHLSLVHARQGRLDQAEADIKEAARRHPGQAEMLSGLRTHLGSEAQAAPARLAHADAGDDPHASVPVPGMTAPSAPITSDARSVAGSLDLGPGVKGSLSPNAVVFLTVRAPGVASGPPLAAKRLTAASFPLPFRVGSADSMMGAPLPDRVRVDARVDADGDPLTRGPSDPSASADAVALGTSGLRLVLRTMR